MTNTPNYNDGNWHGWSGGDCPVHPKTTVEAVWHDPCRNAAGFQPERTACEDEGPRLAWAHVVKFRVIKSYREPRESWSVCGSHLETEEKAMAFRQQLADKHPGKGYENSPITKWREVIE